MNAVRKERYGLRQVDSFNQAIGIKPQDINLPPLKSTEIWNSPVFQALYAQQQAVETEAELDARKAQLYALMKRVAAEKRLPIEDIKRTVNEVARGPGGGGGQLPAAPPVGSYEMELRQGEEVLGGDAMAALMQHVRQAALVDEAVLPQELRVHGGVRAAIGDAGAEHDALAIDTQAQESLRAIQARDEDMQLARKHEDEVMQLFSLKSARRAAVAAGKGAARAAHAFAQYIITPEEEESWMAPSPGLFGVLKDIGGDISSTASWAMSESPETTRRMQPYRAAVQDIRYDVPMREDPEPERPARRRKVAGAIQEGGSSSSSSSTAVAVPSYGATAGKLKNPMRITREDVEGVIDKLSAVRDFGFGVGGLGY
jgi:hypothetical protein